MMICRRRLRHWSWPGRGAIPVTGWSYARIGQQSRVMHATQAMGRWVTAADEQDFPLHLAQSHVAGPDDEIGSGLAQTLRDLDLPGAQDACDAAIAAFPERDAVLRHAAVALQLLQEARARCAPETAHKLARKEQQLARVITLAAGVSVHGWFADDLLHPGDATRWAHDARSDLGQGNRKAAAPGWMARGRRKRCS